MAEKVTNVLAGTSWLIEVKVGAGVEAGSFRVKKGILVEVELTGGDAVGRTRVPLEMPLVPTKPVG